MHNGGVFYETQMRENDLHRRSHVYMRQKNREHKDRQGYTAKQRSQGQIEMNRKTEITRTDRDTQQNRDHKDTQRYKAK